jgi:hypothetical protein
MKRLAQRIESDLKTSKVSAIYNSELERVFPKTMPSQERQASIRRFAIKHGLDVDIFEVGLCAVFEKAGSGKTKKTRTSTDSGRKRR